jgi:adenosylcobinamide-GDP ribazoletransferase
MTAPFAGDDLHEPPPALDGGDISAHRSSGPLRSVRAAFAFFTQIPVGGFPFDDRELAWAPAHAPLVGAVIGAPLGALAVSLLPLGALASAMIVIGASMLLTGALHEDGLADTSDALGGGRAAEQVFAILKDTRIGAFGAAALAVSIFSRASLLGQMGEAVLWALPLSWCAARVGPIWLMAFLPYVTPESKAKSRAVVRADWRQALVASCWFFAASAWAIERGVLSVARADAVGAAVITISAVSGWRYHRRVGGITGDFLGATEQLGEIAALAVLAWPSS